MTQRLRAALLGLALAASPAAALPRHTWVVVVGNNQGAPGEEELRYAETDAKAVGDALRLHAGVPSSQQLQLLGEGPEQIRHALLELNARLRADGSGEPSALIVFYSGHADASGLHLGGATLPMEELKALVEGSPAAVRVLIVDACRSGALTRVKGVVEAPSFALETKDDVAMEGLAIITSSAAGESSQESDRLSSSFFTHHFVNALRGAADANGDAKVTLTEAYAYTYQQTLRSSGSTLALQHPTYAYDLKGRGDLVLATPVEHQGRAGRLTLGSAVLHVVTRERADGPVVAEVVPQGSRRTLTLPAATYFVQERRPDEFREYEVRLGAGERAELEGRPFRSVRYDRLVRQRGGERTSVVQASVAGGVRGAQFAVADVGPTVQLGVGVDFAWGTLGVRVRGFTGAGLNDDATLRRRDWEGGLGVFVSRSVDWPWVTVSFGVLLEAVGFWQHFDTTRTAPPRAAAGAAFTALFAAERELLKAFSVRLEGGPVASLFPLSTPGADGTATVRVGSAVTFFVSVGAVWRW